MIQSGGMSFPFGGRLFSAGGRLFPNVGGLAKPASPKKKTGETIASVFFG
jgi:hypothetical protein